MSHAGPGAPNKAYSRQVISQNHRSAAPAIKPTKTTSLFEVPNSRNDRMAAGGSGRNNGSGPDIRTSGSARAARLRWTLQRSERRPRQCARQECRPLRRPIAQWSEPYVTARIGHLARTGATCTAPLPRRLTVGMPPGPLSFRDKGATRCRMQQSWLLSESAKGLKMTVNIVFGW